MDRRQFLNQSILPLVASASVDEQAGDAGQVGLKEKFLGCIAGCHVGSALKGPV